MNKTKRKNITTGLFLLFVYIPWTMVSMAYIPNSTWLTHVGVCALVTLVGIGIAQWGSKTKEN